jgi:hypothetical protein
MTGPEHYAEAEKWARLADEQRAEGDAGLEWVQAFASIGQVHATLALAATAALGMAGLPAADWDEWRPLVSRATRPGDAEAGRG